MAIGVFCIAYFSQITGFYFLLVIAVIGLRYFYIWAKANLFFANAYDNTNETLPARFPLSETFSEDTFKKMNVLDLRALRLCREQWLTKQQSNGLVFITLATLCLVTTYFTAPPTEVAVAPKAPVVKKALSIEQVLDAGSVQAAEALKLISGAGRPLTGRLLMLDGRSMEFNEVRIGRQADCLVCGKPH